MKRFLIPLALFFVLVGFLAVGLNRDPREVPSPLVNKPAPAFTLEQLALPEKKFSPADMKGQVWMLNVWASWCVSCRDEHSLLLEFARRQAAPLIGLNYKDEATAAGYWLEKHGNPYTASIMDIDGRTGIDYGVYGVPETFVIDRRGLIRHKHTGPLTEADLDNVFLPLIEKLQAENP